MLTRFLTRLGFTRDWAGWFWLRLVTAAALLLNLSADQIHSGLQFLGFNVPDVWIHRILAVAVAVLWIAGKQDYSGLKSKAERDSVPIPKP